MFKSIIFIGHSIMGNNHSHYQLYSILGIVTSIASAIMFVFILSDKFVLSMVSFSVVILLTIALCILVLRWKKRREFNILDQMDFSYGREGWLYTVVDAGIWAAMAFGAHPLSSKSYIFLLLTVMLLVPFVIPKKKEVQ